MFKRGGVWWAWKREGTRKVRRSTHCKDRTAAAAVIREWERAAADPAYRGALAATLAQGVVWLKADRKRRGRAEGTLEMYDQKTAHLGRVLGDQSLLADVTAARVDAYVETREAELAAPSTIHKELVALRGILKLARRRGAFHLEPAAVMPIGFSPKYEPRTTFLPFDRWLDLLVALPIDRAAHVALILCTGARWSESLRAQPGDVGRVSVRIRGTKTAGSARTIPIVAPLEAMLREAAGHLPFRPWGNVQRDLEAACVAAGVPALTPNDLRRSFASFLVQRGVPFDVVGRLLGHVSGAMVAKTYGQLRPDHLMALVAQYFPVESDCDETARTELRHPATSAASAPTNAAEFVGPAGIEPATDGLKGPASDSASTEENEPPRAARLCTVTKVRALRAYFADAVDAVMTGDPAVFAPAMLALAERAPRSPFRAAGGGR